MSYSFEGRSLARAQSETPGVVVSQHSWELEALVDIFIAQQPINIVEIGSQDGGTLEKWIKYAPDGAHIINIDIMQNKTEDDKKATLERWSTWVEERGDDVKLTTLIAPSQSEATIWAVKQAMPSIDFLFIDGDHTYDGVRADWENYGGFTNGVVAFHDLMTPTNGVQDHIQIGKLWREIQRVGYATRELWATPAGVQSWGGIGVVYKITQKKGVTND